MAIPVALRGDFKASQLRGLARKTKDGPQARRLLRWICGLIRSIGASGRGLRVAVAAV